MSKDEDGIKQSALSNIYFKVSLFLLLFGFLFTLGQAIYLNSFIYLNTFTYIDFLINAVLISPFILLIFAVIGFLSDFLLEPISAIYKLYLSSKNNDKERNEFWLGVVNAISNLLRLLSIPLFLILMFFLPDIKYIIPLLLVFFTLSVLIRFVSQKTKDYAVTHDSDFLKKIENFPSGVIDVFSGSGGLVTTGILVIFFGTTYISIQDKDKTDATIVMDDEKIEVNILTSNSNFIVVYRDDKIELIPRSEIKSIRHDSLYFDDKVLIKKP